MDTIFYLFTLFVFLHYGVNSSAEASYREVVANP